MSDAPETREDGTPLRRGWTTGACATAATRAALTALITGHFPDPVAIILPGGQQPAFALAEETLTADYAEAAVVKDAGDDPDVTHGALIRARVERNSGVGIVFRAGTGVGTITKPGLPLPVGEPAINPVPRQMMRAVVESLCAEHAVAPDFTLTLSVRDGEKLAQKTWNPRLGIVGGLSILGTTGIVIPYSCSAWIHSIHRGIDVARAIGLTHVVGSVGDTSEKAAMARLQLPIEAYLDMGDFVGGLLKYLKSHPVPHLTIAGGFAKLSKLAQGIMDLHSARGGVDLDHLANTAETLGADPDLVAAIRAANTAAHALTLTTEAGLPLADIVATEAKAAAEAVVSPATHVSILITDREGRIVGEAE